MAKEFDCDSLGVEERVFKHGGKSFKAFSPQDLSMERQILFSVAIAEYQKARTAGDGPGSLEWLKKQIQIVVPDFSDDDWSTMTARKIAGVLEWLQQSPEKADSEKATSAPAGN